MARFYIKITDRISRIKITIWIEEACRSRTEKDPQRTEKR